nr:AraC family transcriptional regulator [Pseudomaricurvus alcaniphilus]
MEPSRADGQQMADYFFSQTNIHQLLHTFDMLPHTLIWIKDRASRIMFANRCFLHQYGVSGLADLIGKCDTDFSPRAIARQFIEDDCKVLAGKQVEERLELNILRTGEICWFLTSKHPLLADSGDIIGTYGLSRRLEKSSISLAAVRQLELSIDYIRSHFCEEIEIAALARVSCLSVSALERRFKKYLHKSPKQFVNEIRLEHARRLLADGSEPIADIAMASGFADPSYFTRLFSRYFGCPPTHYRRLQEEP